MSNEITLVPNKRGELVDPNTTKIEHLETKLDEIQENLIDLASDADDAVKNLVQLSIASQNPEYFEALAKLIMATARANGEAAKVMKEKRELYNDLRKNNAPEGEGDDGVKTVNNTLVLTSNELLDQILTRK